MLSPINKDSFNLDISKIKLNNKEPFQGENNKFEFENRKAYLSDKLDFLPIKIFCKC